MIRFRSQLIPLISLTICGQMIESGLIESNPTVKLQFSSSKDSDSAWIKENFTDSLDYAPLANIKKYKICGSRDGCSPNQDKHLQPPLFFTLSQNVWGSKMCFCDNDCYEYGDCCISKIISGKSPINNVPRKQNLNCLPINKDYGVYSVTTCNTDSELSKLCAKTNVSDIYTDLAVYSKSTGTVYANIYCALCNSVKPSDISFPNYWVECVKPNIELDDLEYINGEWYMKEDSSGKNSAKQVAKCSLIQEGFPKESRICIARLIDTCPSPREDLKQACQAYSQPVDSALGNPTKKYKNPHCALCHEENIKNLSCALPQTFKVVPLGSLMDFDWDFNTCQWPETLWDGTSQTCLPLDCQSDICSIANHSVQPSKEKVSVHIEIYMTVVVLLISITLLLCHNLIYYIQTKRQNVPSQILKNVSWSIIFGHISFLMIDLKFSVPLPLCKGIAMSTQFFYCASFFWMNVMSYDVWRTFSTVSLRGSSSTLVRKYSVYAWGCPALIVCLTLISDLTNILPDNYRPHIGIYQTCWFSDKLVLAIYFFFPIFIILLSNLFFFTRTVLWFQKQTSKEFESVNNEATGRKEYRKLCLYIKLSAIMGLTWLFCVVSSLTKVHLFRYIFTIFNGLQGAIIFVMFDLKRNTLYQIVDSVKTRTSWNSSSLESKILPGGETTVTNISRNLKSTSLKFNNNKK